MSIDLILSVLSNRYVQLVVSFVAGLLLCSVFLPSKTIEERVKQEYQALLDKETKEKQELKSSLDKTKEDYERKITQNESEYRSEIASLRSQLKEYSSKKKYTTHKIIRSDGSSEEWTTLESEDSLVESIVDSVKKDYENKIKIAENTVSLKKDKEILEHNSYSLKIDELKKEYAKIDTSRLEVTNPRKFGAGVGVSTDRAMYVHGHYNFLGPIFIEGHVQTDLEASSAGIGLGIMF